MKKILTFVFLGVLASSDAQYFRRNFNLDYSTPRYREEVMNSGLRTRVNYASGKPGNYFFMSIGTSYLNGRLTKPDNRAHRMRIARTTRDGASVSGNYGFEFFRSADDNKASLNSTGNSIAEIDNGQGTGGYIAVGAVGSNKRTKAIVPGGSDASFVMFDNGSNVTGAISLDFGNTGDTAWCVRRSVFEPRTYLVCGHSYYPQSGNTVAFVARLTSLGTIVWAYTYAFDATMPEGLSSVSRARQLCEDPKTGRIYVVGTHLDRSRATNVNGLAFGLNPNGTVLWSSVYDVARLDEFQAVRFSQDEHLLVGGQSNHSAATNSMTNMLLTKLRPADGSVVWKTLLRAGNKDLQYNSKCFDLVEGPETDKKNIFLVGPGYAPWGTSELMYKTDYLGMGINNYTYQIVGDDSLFAIDLDNYNTATTGLAIFSNIKSEVSGLGDGSVFKTTISGATCINECPAGTPKNIAIDMKQIKMPYNINQIVNRQGLGNRLFKYGSELQCNQKAINCDLAHRPMLEEQPKIDMQLKAYPNPVGNTLFLYLDEAQLTNTEVLVHNLLGQAIMCKVTRFAKGVLQVDVSRLQKGSYILTLRQNGKVRPINFIKQ